MYFSEREAFTNNVIRLWPVLDPPPLRHLHPSSSLTDPPPGSDDVIFLYHLLVFWMQIWQFPIFSTSVAQNLPIHITDTRKWEIGKWVGILDDVNWKPPPCILTSSFGILPPIPMCQYRQMTSLVNASLFHTDCHLSIIKKCKIGITITY